MEQAAIIENMKQNHKLYDATVVGGGHNGLVAASYLAKAGKSVLLLEAQANRCFLYHLIGNGTGQ